MRNAIQCNECSSFDIVTDFSAGDVVCRDCGIVIGDRIIDEQDELRTFANDDRGTVGLSRAGESSNGHSSESVQLNTYISGSGDGFSELRKRDAQISSKDKYLTLGHGQISYYSEKLGLQKCISSVALAVYTKAQTDMEWKVKKQIYLAAVACIYIACRKTNNTRTIKEMELISGFEKKKIGKMFKMIVRVSDIQLVTTTVADFIERFCNVLNLPMKTRNTAKLIATRAASLNITLGRTGAIVAAASIYLVAALTNMSRSMQEIAKVSTCAEASVKRVSKELNKHRFQLFEGISLT